MCIRDSNAGLKFLCKTVTLNVATAQSDFTSGYAKGQQINVPIAHHDGNYTIDAAGLDVLRGEDRIAFTYAATPNGAMADIAGVLSQNRRVLGMMPVSYTHLDVYKRQVIKRGRGAFGRGFQRRAHRLQMLWHGATATADDPRPGVACQKGVFGHQVRCAIVVDICLLYTSRCV